MALIDRDKVVRRAIPHEPGAWIEFRQLSWEDWPDADAIPKGKQATRAALLASIAGWSYPDPVTPENIARLDVQTMTWAAKEAVRVNGGDLTNLAASLNGSTSETTGIHPN